MSASQLIERLSSIHPKGFDLSLERIGRVLLALGNPQEKISPVIHVAGTNGKGSTVAFCRAILEAAGKSVHVHTSPHLVDWRERFRMGAKGGGVLVDDRALEDAINRVAEANGGRHITIFEILTAAVFVLFAEHPADYCVIEVGLGGRFDATNVIANPLVSVITSIGFDHLEHLGDTLEKIAFEKAGIIKRRRPVVIGPQEDEARETLEKIARERAAPAFVAGTDFTFHQQAGRFVYQDETGLIDLPLPRLAGPHQLANAATAIAAIRHAGIAVADEAIEAAMRTVCWPGRLEKLKHGKLSALAPKTAELWIDGGHNPAGAKAIALALAEMEERAPMPLLLIAGMLSTKDSRGFFEAFAGLAEAVITVPVPGSEASREPGELAAIARQCGLPAEPRHSIAEALKSIGGKNRKPLRVLICGSLYLIGDVLSANGTPPE